MNVFRNEAPAFSVNNPGHLQSAYGMKYPTNMRYGMAEFHSMSDGVEALAAQTWDFYVHHGLMTLPAFVAQFIQSRNLDALEYQRQLLTLLNWSPLQVKTAVMHLDRSFQALQFMRALVIVENGVPPSGWLPPSEWIDLTTWTTAMIRTTRWRIV